MADNVTVFKRFTFKCWNCEETYSVFKEVDLAQKLQVKCTYCHANADVDFRPFHRRKKGVLHQKEISKKTILHNRRIGEYTLPKILPTEKLK